MGKLWARVWCLVFLRHSVYTVLISGNLGVLLFLVETEPDIRYVPNTVFLVLPWQQQQQQHGLYCVSSGLVYVLCGLSNVSDASRRSNYISQWPIAPSSLTDIHPTAVIIHKRSYIKYHSLHLRQPRTNLSISDIPCLMSGTSSMGSVDSPLSSFFTPHSFIPDLNLPFLQILLTVAFLFFSTTDSADSPDCLPILPSNPFFLLFSFFSFPLF